MNLPLDPSFSNGKYLASSTVDEFGKYTFFNLSGLETPEGFLRTYSDQIICEKCACLVAAHSVAVEIHLEHHKATDAFKALAEVIRKGQK